MEIRDTVVCNVAVIRFGPKACEEFCPILKMLKPYTYNGLVEAISPGSMATGSTKIPPNEMNTIGETCPKFGFLKEKEKENAASESFLPVVNLVTRLPFVLVHDAAENNRSELPASKTSDVVSLVSLPVSP